MHESGAANRDAEADKLWDTYFKTKDPDIKKQLLSHYLYLVIGVVKRIMPQYRTYCDQNDLISSGVIGLIDAVDKYDRSFETKFQTYAAIRIKGEVLDYLRKQDWASTSLRRKLSEIQKAVDDLELKLGRAPSDEELAESLGMSEKEIAEALRLSQMFNVISFESLLYEKENVNVSGGVRSDPYTNIEKKETMKLLRDVISELPEKERMVIVLHYYEGLTMKNIAKVLKVSESRVSQIHSKVLVKMKKQLETSQA